MKLYVNPDVALAAAESELYRLGLPSPHWPRPPVKRDKHGKPRRRKPVRVSLPRNGRRGRRHRMTGRSGKHSK